MDCRKTLVPEQQPEEAYRRANSLRKEKSPTEGPVEPEAHQLPGGEKKGHRPTGWTWRLPLSPLLPAPSLAMLRAEPAGLPSPPFS